MSDLQLKVKINRLVLQSGYEKSDNMICPIMKIIQMRYKDVLKNQALRVTKMALQ